MTGPRCSIVNPIVPAVVMTTDVMAVTVVAAVVMTPDVVPTVVTATVVMATRVVALVLLHDLSVPVLGLRVGRRAREENEAQRQRSGEEQALPAARALQPFRHGRILH